MTTASSKFYEDLSNAFDLINRNLLIQNKREIYISLSDLKHYNFGFDQYWQILNYLEEKHGFNILKANSPSMPIGSDVTVPGAVNTFLDKAKTDDQFNFTIRVPNDFEQKYQKYNSSDINSPDEKIEIFYSDKEGLYRYYGVKKLNYAVNGNRAKLVQMLIGSQNTATPANIFIKAKIGKNFQTISQAVNKINDLCISKLKITDKLIDNLNKGYFINTEKFKISK